MCKLVEVIEKAYKRSIEHDYSVAGTIAAAIREKFCVGDEHEYSNYEGYTPFCYRCCKPKPKEDANG